MPTALGAGVKPTKGYLLQLKSRLRLVEEGHRVLELKRDECANQLRINLEELDAKRSNKLQRVEAAFRRLALTYASLGSNEMASQLSSIEKTLQLKVLPKSVMGIIVPYIKIEKKPSVTNKLGPVIRSVADEISKLVEELLDIAQLESRIERIADDLESTNRKVNALEKIVIPEYKILAKHIEDQLDQDMLEEFIRTRFVRSIISGKKTNV